MGLLVNTKILFGKYVDKESTICKEHPNSRIAFALIEELKLLKDDPTPIDDRVYNGRKFLFMESDEAENVKVTYDTSNCKKTIFLRLQEDTRIDGVGIKKGDRIIYIK